MPFLLVHDERELSVQLELDASQELRLAQMLDAADHLSPEKSDIAERLGMAISAVIEARALPPTEKQLKYALNIARELTLNLPAETLQYRDAMTAFIGQHAERYRAKVK